jgi:rubrerythrin
MNAIETAARMEQEAVEFYQKCAEKTTHPMGKKMFLSIAEDEKYHFECALQMTKEQHFIPAATRPIEDMKKLFEDHRKETLMSVPSSADELEALKVAMKMEKEAIDFYRNAAAKAKNDKEKHFFECLVMDEEEHFHIFQNTHSFLEDSGNWYMWEEKGIVEG